MKQLKDISFDVRNLKSGALKAYILFVALIMPLMVIKTVFMSRLYTYAFASAYEHAVDHYLVYRTTFFVVFSAIAALILLFGKNRRIGIYPVLFVCLLILSVILSKDRLLSLAGCDEQFEGVFVLLSYVVVFYASKYLTGVEGGPGFMKRILCISLILNSLICIVQGAAMNVKAYGTLYNSNYAGFFLAVLIPVTLWQLISDHFGEKEPVMKQTMSGQSSLRHGIKWLPIPTLIFALIAIIMTGARTAVAAVVLVAVIMIIYRFFPSQKVIFILSAVVMTVLIIVLVSAFFSAGAGTYSNKVKDVSILEEGIGFDLGGEVLTVAFDMPDEDHYYFVVKNESGEELPYDENAQGTMYEIKDERYDDFSFTIADYGSFKGFLVYTDNRTWYFYRDTQGEYFYLNGYTRPEKFVRAPFIGFEKNEGFASNRGYIWSRTLGLFSCEQGSLSSKEQEFMASSLESLSHVGIKELFLGFGPDTFATVFPQNDVNKYLLTDIPYKMIITRPHSFFLQTGVQLGIPMFCLLLWLGAGLFAVSVKKQDPVTALTLLLFAICGLFYDSTPIVMPVFMLILGMKKD